MYLVEFGAEQDLTKEIQKIEVDLVDVSSGGNHPKQEIPTVPGYQVCTIPYQSG